MSRRYSKPVKNDDLGPVGTVILGLLILFGPVYGLLGDLLWVLLLVAATCAVLAGINWLFTRYK